jgi:hypothetical protein
MYLQLPLITFCFGYSIQSVAREWIACWLKSIEVLKLRLCVWKLSHFRIDFFTSFTSLSCINRLVQSNYLKIFSDEVIKYRCKKERDASESFYFILCLSLLHCWNNWNVSNNITTYMTGSTVCFALVSILFLSTFKLTWVGKWYVVIKTPASSSQSRWG